MNSADSAQPLAIIGIGCLFPGAADFEGYWANIVKGTDGITDVPAGYWRSEDYYHADPKRPDFTYANRGGFLDPVSFNPAAYGIAPNSIEATDTAQLLGLVAAQRALEDAGYVVGDNGAGKPLDRGSVSVILGVTGTLELVIPLGARLGHPIWRRALKEAGVEAAVAEDVVQRIGDSYVGWQESSFPGLLGNVVAGRIANRFDLGGTNCVVDAACASSLSAIHLAAMELHTGRADVVITGGIDTFNDIFMYMCFSKTPALSPSGNAKPFDANGDGTILGEGLGVVILKRLADARRDGDRIYATIRGMGTSSDGKGNAIYAPKAEGQIAALNQAYRLASVTPDTIELVEAHGTGTKVGDATEVAALTEVYQGSGRAGTWCALGSVKSQIGHTKAAAGAAGLIKAAAALYHKVLPPTIKVTQPTEALRPGRTPFYVNTEKRPWLPSPDHPRRAGVSAFGFGGSNFHCVLEEADPHKPAIDWDGDVQIVAFSGDSPQQIAAQLASFPTDLKWPGLRIRAARSRETVAGKCRLLLVVENSRTDLVKLLASARTSLEKSAGKQSWRSLDGIYYGSGAAGKLGVLFPGQGAQYVGMFRDLACHFPAGHETLSAADTATARQPRLSDLLYPPAAFDAATRTANETALRATDVAQPALGAVSLGAYRVLQAFGVEAAAFGGHSYGELTALCAAGCLSVVDFFSVSQVRGRLMADAGKQGDAGSMLAVHAPPEAILPVLRDEKLELTLANKNSPEQTVLSGPTAAIERAATALSARQLRCTRLPVAAAFHSPLVAGAEAPFRAALEKVAFQPPRVPVYANTTARPYPHDPSQARDQLAGQLARPVEFVAEIEALYAAGVRTFLEVGPRTHLTGMVSATLAGREHEAFALDGSSGQRSGFFDLASTLAWLASLGYDIQLALWDDGTERLRRLPPESRKPTFTVELGGANYVKPKATRPPTPRAPLPAAKPVLPPPPKREVATPTMNGSRSTPPPPPLTSPPDGSALTQALQVTRETLTALQRMQEQTALLHRQFLEGQESAQRGVHLLIEQQQRLLQASLGMVPLPLAALPAPAASPPLAALQPPAPPPPLAAKQPPLPVAPLASPQAAAVPNRIEKILLDVISEKTGYPPEMLELDMALDADLGIDSIKRVEILSALQERLPDAPQIKPEHLGTLHNLRQIVAFLANGAGAAILTPTTNGTMAHAVPSVGGQEEISLVLLEVISEKTGYPPEMLELDMALDADLGIDSIKRVEILSALQERLPNAPQIKPEHLGTLHNLRQIVGFLAGSSSSEEQPRKEAATPSVAGPFDRAESLTATIERSVLRAIPLPIAARPAVRLSPGAEIWVTSDAPELANAVGRRLRHLGYLLKHMPLDALPKQPRQNNLSGLVVIAPQTGVDATFVKNALFGVQTAATGLRNAGKQGAGLLVTVSRLNGAFGLRGIDADRDPLDGGLAGLTKTASHEWPEVACKAIDLADDFANLDEAAAAIVEEMLLAGPLEVGLAKAGRCTLERVVEALPSHPTATPLQRGEVVVVSGGARGVTAEVAVALAAAFQPMLVLLGRSPAPEPEPDWLRHLTGETDIKRELGQHANGKASLKLIGEQYQQVMAQREVRQTLARIEAAGARAVYRTVDIRNAAAVAELLKGIRREIGTIRGLIHGAGVLADARIEDKTTEQFDRVYGTKVEGLRSLLNAINLAELRVLVLFSSSTGRFGRTGQVDYAIANEILNKTAQQQARRLPDCRVVAVNWGPWDGGMVTPALKKLFEQEGVGLIGLRAGADYLVRELQSEQKQSVEVVILGHGQPVAQTPQPVAVLPMVFERVLDVQSHPVLKAHVLNGRPVLPMALMLEYLANGAMHQNPGLAFHGCDDFRILHGVVLEDDQPLTLRVGAGKAVKGAEGFVASVELRTVRADGRETLHARAAVVLTTTLPAAPAPTLRAAQIADRPYPYTAAELYRDRLFHGPDLQGIERVEGHGEHGIAALVHAAPPPAEWLANPLRQQWLTDPLAVDVGFQLLILWSLEQRGAASLPCFVQRYRQYRRAFPDGGMRVVAQVARAGALNAVADLEFVDAEGRLIARMEGYECVIDPALRRAFERRVLVNQ